MKEMQGLVAPEGGQTFVNTQCLHTRVLDEEEQKEMIRDGWLRCWDCDDNPGGEWLKVWVQR